MWNSTLELPRMIMMIRETTLRQTKTFCQTVAFSPKKTEAIICAIIGTMAKMIEPSIDEEKYSPITCSTIKPT